VVEELQALSAFDAPDGTVWEYVFIANAHRSDVTLFMVLPTHRTIEHEASNHQTEFRQYLDLLTGELAWFAAGSPLNRRAERIG
jgi:hypothetical protein